MDGNYSISIIEAVLGGNMDIEKICWDLIRVSTTP